MKRVVREEENKMGILKTACIDGDFCFSSTILVNIIPILLISVIMSIAVYITIKHYKKREETIKHLMEFEPK